MRYSFLRRSFSLAGSVEGEEGAGAAAEEEAGVAVEEVEAAGAFAVAVAAVLGFLGALAVFGAPAGVVASPAPSLPAPPPAEEEEEQEGEETEANCRRAINDDDAFEACQHPIPAAFAAPLPPWSKLL